MKNKGLRFPLMRNNIQREDIDAVIAYLRQDDPILTNGEQVKSFEAEWSKWLGVRYSVFVNSGASANLLTLAILKLRYPAGGDVVVPSFTWVSDIAAVIQNGFRPVFVDIDPRSLAMDTKGVIKALTPQTRAVFLTHAQGFDGLTDELIDELRRRNIPLLEDVCESHGATHNGKKLGTIGWISNFSFYYAHHMSTIEGGMICTNDQEVYQQARVFRSHGLVREATDREFQEAFSRRYPALNREFIFAYPAYNVRNTEIGGILGCSQLKRLDQNIAKRTANLHRFLNAIDADKYRTDFKVEGSSNYAFNLILKRPDEELVEKLMNAMRDNGVEFRRGSVGGGNQLRQPYLQGIVPPDFHRRFPETEHVHFYGFYLGNFPDLTDAEIDELCSIVNRP